MDRHLTDCIQNTVPDHYILPFFWQHGEDHETLLHELEAIYSAGLREFCVESRTHEAFMQDQWFTDFGFLLEEAAKRGMKVWLLDDKRFPTGYANGYVKDHPELRKRLLRMSWLDFQSSGKPLRLMVPPLGQDEKLIGAVAFCRDGNGERISGDPVDLYPSLTEGLVRMNVPKGCWRVFWMIETRKGLNRNYDDWIDMIDEESCESMITAVYEPTYSHFSEYFGNTFKGFFSDEPCFGNDGGGYLSRLGKKQMPIPWRMDLPELIAEDIHSFSWTPEKVRLYLPLLFHDYYDQKESEELSQKLSCLRIHYMNVITKLYRKCFTKRLSSWCRAHGVVYIGHVIEDMGSHMRLGYGPGHYFRALCDQDMAGIDIVLHQIIPGMLEETHPGLPPSITLDPAFFHYFLGKLPASLSHIMPHMKGRAMCEIFGAFGWAEGIPEMKYLTDHMISNGINYFVPHAFSPKYPDPDCPPHFYAHGNNPQFRTFGKLMDYMKKCAHLMSDGIHRAPAALLYPAEGEWGGSSLIFPERVGKAMIQSQLDYEILWEDILPEVSVEEGECGAKVLKAGTQEYRALVIPGTEKLPEHMLKELRRFAHSGVPVLITQDNDTSETAGKEAVIRSADVEDSFFVSEAVSLSELPKRIERAGGRDISISPQFSHFRYHRIQRDGQEILFFFNEDLTESADSEIEVLFGKENFVIYDPWTGEVKKAEKQNGKLLLKLLPGAALFMISTDRGGKEPADAEKGRADEPGALIREKIRLQDLRVSVSGSGEDWSPVDAKIGTDITSTAGMEYFSGMIRYEGTAVFSGGEQKLCLPEVGEAAEVWINGTLAGTAFLQEPAVPIAGLIRPGENRICIDVMNSLAYRERDRYSVYLPLPGSGLLDDIIVEKYKD